MSSTTKQPQSETQSEGQLRAYRSELRRSHMTPGQRGDLARLAIATERFRVRNARMALGLQCGFKRVETGEVPSERLLPAAVKVSK